MEQHSYEIVTFLLLMKHIFVNLFNICLVFKKSTVRCC